MTTPLVRASIHKSAEHALRSLAPLQAKVGTRRELGGGGWKPGRAELDRD